MWDPYEKGDAATLEKVQRRAARFVKDEYHRESSVPQFMSDLGWQSLEVRRVVSGLTFMLSTALWMLEARLCSEVDVPPGNPQDSTTTGTSKHTDFL